MNDLQPINDGTLDLTKIRPDYVNSNREDMILGASEFKDRLEDKIMSLSSVDDQTINLIADTMTAVYDNLVDNIQVKNLTSYYDTGSEWW